MSHLPKFNFPAFYVATVDLRTRGHEIVCPAELADPVWVAQALASPDGSQQAFENEGGRTWGDMLARSVRIIADSVRGIVLLPSWETSRGARLEAFTAIVCGHGLFLYTPYSSTGITPITINDVHAQLL